VQSLACDEVIVALGANLDDPADQLRRAFSALSQLDHITLVAQSRLYGSEPVGPKQPDYVNAVAHLQTTLGPHALLDALQALEQAHHRKREQRWGPRTLDLDIVLFGQQQIHDQRLIVPHVAMHERVFVLGPLAELYPQLYLPALGVSVAEQLERIGRSGLWPLDET